MNEEDLDYDGIIKKYFLGDWKASLGCVEQCELKDLIDALELPREDQINTNNDNYSLQNIRYTSFLIDEPISPVFYKIINSEKLNSPEICQQLYPVLIQFTILYSFQLPMYIKGATLDIPGDKNFCCGVYPVLSKFYTYELLPKEEFYIAISPSIQIISQIISQENVFPVTEFGFKFTSEFMKIACLYLINPNHNFAQNSEFLTYLESLLDFYASNTSTITKFESFEKVNIIIKSLDMWFIMHLKDGCISDGCETMKTILMLLNNLIQNQDMLEEHNDKLYVLFNNLISLIIHLTHSNDISKIFIQNLKKSTITSYILWCIDMYPILNQNLTEEFNACKKTPIKTNDENKPEDFSKNNININITEIKQSYNNLLLQINKNESLIPYSKLSKLISLIQEFQDCPCCVDLFKNIFRNCYSYVDFLMSENYCLEHHSDKVTIAITLILFVYELFTTADNSLISEVFSNSNISSSLFVSFLFNPKFDMNLIEHESPNYFEITTHAMLSLIKRVFLSLPSYVSQFLASSMTLLEPQYPHTAIFLFGLLESVFVSDQVILEGPIEEILFIDTLATFMRQIKSSEESPEVYRVILSGFNLVKTLSSNSRLCLLFYSSENFSKMIYHFLFDDLMRSHIMDIFISCFVNKDFDVNLQHFPYKYIKRFIEKASNEVLSLDYEKAGKEVIKTLYEIIPISASKNQEIIIKTENIESIALFCLRYNDQQTYQCTFDFLHFISRYISDNKNIGKNILTKQLSKNLIKVLSDKETEVSPQIINQLLMLAYGSMVGIGSPSHRVIEVANPDIFVIIHHITKGTQKHASIFKHLCSVCQPSMTNKLQICNSDIIPTVLEFIKSFDDYSKISKIDMDSINILISLFSTVSSLSMKKSVLTDAIRMMKPKEDGSRQWWTTFIVNAFTEIQTTKYQELSSFFRISSKEDGLELPSFPSTLITKGFTIAVRFIIDQNWQRISQNPSLFSIKTSSNQILELSLNDQTISAFYSDKISSKSLTDSIPINFREGIIHFLALVFSKNSIIVYKNGLKIGTLKLSISFEGDIQSCCICNRCKNITGIPSPLICSISVFYMFNSSLSVENISRLAQLPVEFAHDFSHEMLLHFPNINIEEGLQKNLICCYNPRMVHNGVCTNLVNVIGDATIHGSVVPSSSSFVDVLLEIGGISIFFPLFEQVSMRVNDHESDSSEPFLFNILTLFMQLMEKAVVADHFVKKDGFKLLTTALCSLSYETITVRHIVLLKDILDCLTRSNKLVMLRDLWFVPRLWKSFTKEIQIYVLRSQFPYFLSEMLKEVSEVVSFDDMLAMVNCENDIEIRKEIWGIVSLYIKSLPSESSYEDLYFFAMSSFVEKMELEALELLYDLCETDPLCAKTVIEKKDHFMAYICLFQKANEDLIIYGIRFFCLINKLIENNIINAPYFGFEPASHLASICLHKSEYPKVFDFIHKGFFSDDKLRSEYLELFASLSSHFNGQMIKSFVEEINMKFDCEELCELFIRWKHWYILVFEIILNTNVFTDFSSPDLNPYIDLYVSIMASLVSKNDDQSFNEVISFFYMIENYYLWNMSIIIRRIMLGIISKIGIDIPSENLQLLISIVIQFLFFIPSTEKYGTNYQLYSLYKRKFPELFDYASCSFFSLLSVLKNAKEKPLPSIRFSARFDDKNVWLDYQIGFCFLELLVKSKFKNDLIATFFDIQFTVIDLAAIIGGHLIRSQFNGKEKTIDLMYEILQRNQSNQAFYIFSNDLIHAINKEPYLYNNYIPLLTIYHPDPQITTALMEHSGISSSFIYGKLTSLEHQFEVLIMSRIQAHLNSFSGYESLFSIQLPIISSNECIRKIAEILQQQNIQKVEYTSKYHRMINRLKSDGGPWSELTSIHWKLSKCYDMHYRHCYFKVNMKYTDHLDAVQKSWKESRYIRTIDTIQESVSPASEFSFSITTNVDLVDGIDKKRGTFYMNTSDIYFQSIEKIIHILVSDITLVLHRSKYHIDYGLEFFLKERKSYFFLFLGGDRQKIIDFLRGKCKCKKVQNCSSSEFFEMQGYTESWKAGKITNFDYLMLLNLYSGRSLNDLSQYPIFPWILSDYTSLSINLNDPSVYRNLSKPMGALNQQKLMELRTRMIEGDSPFKCLYLLSLSSCFSVTRALIRIEPYASRHIELHDGRFDLPMRQFLSIADEWKRTSINGTDYTELIPEYFYLPDMFKNLNEYKLGQEFGDVDLPPWAVSAEDFVNIHQQALESPYVSQHINEWIDLIFGYKQRGEEADKADNTFHPYCYETSITPEVLNDTSLLYHIQTNAENIGVLPRVLFNQPHPKRSISPLVPQIIGQSISSLDHIFSTNLIIIALGRRENNRIIFVSSVFEIFEINSNFRDKVTPKGVLKVDQGSKVIVLDDQNIAVASTNRNYFEIFNDNGEFVSKIVQPGSLIKDIRNIDSNLLLVTWQDSLVTVYAINSCNNQLPIFEISGTSESIIAADLSVSLGIIAVTDSNGNANLIDIIRGRSIQQFMLNVSDPLRDIGLANSGYFWLVSDHYIFVHRMNGEISNKTKVGSKITVSSYGEFQSGLSFLAIGLESADLIVFDIPALTIISSATLSNSVSVIDFDSDNLCFIAIDYIGEISKIYL